MINESEGSEKLSLEIKKIKNRPWPLWSSHFLLCGAALLQFGVLDSWQMNGDGVVSNVRAALQRPIQARREAT